MKECSICKISKKEENYNRNKSKKDGLNTICQECSRRKSKEYYKGNKTNHIAAVGERNKKQRIAIRKFMLDYLSSNSCVDCGNTDIRVLEFDHLPKYTKSQDISRMTSKTGSIKSIEKEIAKCEIVCANCHRIRTVERSEKNYRKVSKAHVEVAPDS